MGTNGVQSTSPDAVKVVSPEINRETGSEKNGSLTEHHAKLLDLGLQEPVAAKLDSIYAEDLVKHEELDDRAFDALKEFEADGACAVLQQFRDSNLSHVQNKSAFLCGVMKTYRQRQKAIAEGRLQPAQQGHPDEAKIKELLSIRGYSLDVTTGQRKYGGPPPSTVCDLEAPLSGAEVFIGKIPRDMFEDELIPLFEKCGTIWDFRLMMDPMTGQNRGYSFLSYVEQDAADKCVKMYDKFEIRPKRELHVTVSQPNNRLFVGSIPKTKTKEEIFEEFSKHTTGLTDVILYYQVDDKNKTAGLQKNRGFCFLEYDHHQAASQARRRLLSGRVKAWNNLVVTVDWADPINTPGMDIMEKVKVLYVKNLANSVSEESLKCQFSAYGDVEKAKKIKDYAFVHFKERDHATAAMKELNGINLEGQCIEICLAKPQDKKLKERKMERQLQKQMVMHGGFGFGFGGGRMGPPGGPRFPGPGPWNMNGGGYGGFGPYGNGGGGGYHDGGYGGGYGYGGDNGFGGYQDPFYMAGPGMNRGRGNPNGRRPNNGQRGPNKRGGGGGGRRTVKNGANY